MQSTLKIGQLSKRTGVSADTLRYYEQHGLLKPSSRTASGYRLYDAKDQRTIEFILAAKQVGFSLNEIGELLALEVTRDQATCADVKTIVDDKLEFVQQKLKELFLVQASLQALSDACCGGGEPATHCTILETLSEGGEAA